MNTFEVFCNTHSYKELNNLTNMYYEKYCASFKNSMDKDDYFQYVCIRLLRDTNFDNSRSTIRTYTNLKIKYISLTMVRDLQAKKRQINYNTLYMNKTPSECEDIDIVDVFSIDDKQEEIMNDELYFNECVEKICNLIKKDSQREVFRLYLKGYTHTQIANEIGNITGQQANSICQTVRKRLQRYRYAVENIMY